MAYHLFSSSFCFFFFVPGWAPNFFSGVFWGRLFLILKRKLLYVWSYWSLYFYLWLRNWSGAWLGDISGVAALFDHLFRFLLDIGGASLFISKCLQYFDKLIVPFIDIYIK
jgi:hypothetical protein